MRLCEPRTPVDPSKTDDYIGYGQVIAAVVPKRDGGKDALGIVTLSGDVQVARQRVAELMQAAQEGRRPEPRDDVWWIGAEDLRKDPWASTPGPDHVTQAKAAAPVSTSERDRPVDAKAPAAPVAAHGRRSAVDWLFGCVVVAAVTAIGLLIWRAHRKIGH